MTPSAPRPDGLRILDWLGLAQFLNAGLAGLGAVAVVLHPAFHGSERLALLGAFLALGGVLLASLDAWAGRCLRQREARGFCLLVAALDCLYPPGALVGLVTLVVLTRPSVIRAFADPGEP